jgi:hypothetical protein
VSKLKSIAELRAFYGTCNEDEGEIKYNNLLQSVDENLLQNFHYRVSKRLGH